MDKAARRELRKIFIAAVFILCASFLCSCVLAKGGENKENEREARLTQSQVEELKWLIQTLHVSHGGASNIIGEGGILDTAEKQGEFLRCLNEMEYEDIFKDRLGEYVTFENDKKLISRENAELLLKMAGALVTADVWQYLSKDYSYNMVSENEFDLPMYVREGSDYYIEYRDWKFIEGDDGKLTVRYKIYRPVFGRNLEYVNVRLHKNKESIWGYSADYLMAVPIELKENTYENEEFFQGSDWGEYERPVNMGKSIDEYIFKLDGVLYQMPFPLNELTLNGWEYTGKLKKDKDRAEITLTKEGKEIYCIVWYCQKREDPKWYVVSLKTGFGEGISDVDFELFGGRKRGDYAYGYGEHGIYGFLDPLYSEAGSYAYAYTGDDKSIKGFCITYAPKYKDRIKRLNEIATYESDLGIITGTGNTELSRDYSYYLDLYDEPVSVEVKSMDKVSWADDMDVLCVKRGDKEEIIGYVEYGKDYTLCIDDKGARIEVVHMEDSPDEEPEVFPIVAGER